MRRDAIISVCGKFRYVLEREWALHGKTLTWCMLNPSTADALDDDPTIRKCIGFSKRWGFGSLVVSRHDQGRPPPTPVDVGIQDATRAVAEAPGVKPATATRLDVFAPVVRYWDQHDRNRRNHR